MPAPTDPRSTVLCRVINHSHTMSCSLPNRSWTVLLCQLWNELQTLEQTVGNNPLIITTDPLSATSCIYDSNPTSAEPLYDLWCKIQRYHGLECSEQCPDIYRNDPERTLLCDLWQELNDLQTSFGELTILCVICGVKYKYMKDQHAFSALTTNRII